MNRNFVKKEVQSSFGADFATLLLQAFNLNNRSQLTEDNLSLEFQKKRYTNAKRLQMPCLCDTISHYFCVRMGKNRNINFEEKNKKQDIYFLGKGQFFISLSLRLLRLETLPGIAMCQTFRESCCFNQAQNMTHLKALNLGKDSLR